MRALVDIGDDAIAALDGLARDRCRSRAALIRDAIDLYLTTQRAAEAADAFGAWGVEAADGLVYQERLRAEW